VAFSQQKVEKMLVQVRTGGEAQRFAVTHFRRLAFNSRASSRVAQLALEKASAYESAILLRALHGHVQVALKSMFANYVMQRAIELLPSASTDFIAEELLGDGRETARHPYGCRILCRILEHGSLNNTVQATLLDEILTDAAALCCHAYGNFVIRHSLEFGHTWHRHKIASALCTNFEETARDVNGSRTIESAMEFCEIAGKQMIAESLLADADKLLWLATDRLGRHVVKAVLRTPGEWQEHVAGILQPSLGTLRESRQGKPVLQALQAFEGNGVSFCRHSFDSYPGGSSNGCV
jgi:hypothetical protein